MRSEEGEYHEKNIVGKIVQLPFSFISLETHNTCGEHCPSVLRYVSLPIK